MRWLLCFILTSQLIAAPFENVEPSTPVEIASLNAHLLIDGYISPLSGQISLQETDLLIKAAQDLMLKRTYVPPQILGRYEDKDRLDRLSLGKALLLQERRRWVMLPHLWAGYNLHSPYFQVYDPSGFVLEFEICDAKGILKTSSYGFSNLRQEEPDSTADLRNIEFFVEQDAVRIIWPEGTERIYRKQSPTLYRLETELLPYGKALRFEARCGAKNLPEVLKVFRHWAMENELSENNEYTWDDRVIVKKDAPEQFYPGRIGTVCRMWEIKFENIAKEFCSELGDWIYLIELETGREIRVAGHFLEKYPEV